MRNNNKITFVPLNGLCNRMRAIASAKVLSEEIGSNLEIAWVHHPRLFAKFSDLFEPIENVEVRNYSIKNPILRKIQRAQFFKTPFPIIEYLTKRKYDLIIHEHEFDEDSTCNLIGKRVLFRSGSEFYNPLALSYTFFQPIKFLEEIINSKAKDFDQHTVGVHVRRNDNKKAILHSTDELFFKEIDSRIEINSDINLFLATDCSKTESMFLNRYGKKVHIFKKKSDVKTIRYSQDSVIDLYLLSRTKEIIGSYWSSFSKTAAKIGNIPIFIVGED